MIEFSNEEREKFKDYLINFFNNAYGGNKFSRKDEEDNFNFLKKYSYFVKLSYGRGIVSKIPWIIFVRMDTQEYKASYGVYVYCGIKRENGEIVVYIGESEDIIINYIAKDKVDEYNTKFNNVVFHYSNLNNDIDVIVDKIIENMHWFKRLPLNEIQDRNALSISNNKEIRNNEKEISNKKENQNPPLNQILYGPPGTGKTYHTIDKALEILGENLANKDRDEKKAKFDEYVKNGQIVFTTFHQSYGYEEFIEGIKPILNDDDNIQELKYEIKDGVFKELCKKALDNRDSIKNFNFYIDKLKEKTKEDDNNPEKYFELPNTKYSIQYRGGETFRIKFDDMSKNYRDYPVNIDNIEKLYKTSSTDEIYNSAYVKAILNYLKLQGLEDYKEKDEKTNLPYIIIIDEINRGNVSKIFGELITLIEPSKRIGEKEELRVRLPYSGEEFGVPKNVYIIGTMNTADRSITSLDTALRRRFEFIEMMPKPNVLSDNCEGVNLQKLLEAINTRIEYLLDREKTIGHAFFIGIDNLEKLKKVFQNKIIPLLQEYFYNDYALIDAVLNENGMLEKQDTNNDYLKNMTDFIESGNVVYKFSDSEDWVENTFIKIYENDK
ncbi:McrBC 5-methylcytosine restriction system, component McrB [Campylobacter lari]|uniref:McrBC 5-methylcytosine restriction system, component McrB n=1 Tax=Campylobacter lari TaxID=201 RepID=UPI00057D1608|nr:McrBC 5-methylcytosine restriction system, component McrB [Campylobacter lari]AJD04302.1 McrBC 5-methylcytosine restriction system, component McrB [Campylobacter lari RM16701]